MAFVGSLTGSQPRLSAESLAFAWFTWEQLPWEQVPATQVAILAAARANPAGAQGFLVD